MKIQRMLKRVQIKLKTINTCYYEENPPQNAGRWNRFASNSTQSKLQRVWHQLAHEYSLLYCLKINRLELGQIISKKQNVNLNLQIWVLDFKLQLNHSSTVIAITVELWFTYISSVYISWFLGSQLLLLSILIKNLVLKD